MGHCGAFVDLYGRCGSVGDYMGLCAALWGLCGATVEFLWASMGL